jgi:hypothetical protein
VALQTAQPNRHLRGLGCLGGLGTLCRTGGVTFAILDALALSHHSGGRVCESAGGAESPGVPVYDRAGGAKSPGASAYDSACGA